MCELNTCTLVAPRPLHSCTKTFPMKFMMLSFIHLIRRRVAMSWRSTLSSPHPRLALTATGLPPPCCHLSLGSLVMTLPVALGVTPRLMMPMASLVTAPGEGSFLRKSLPSVALLLSLSVFLRLFVRVTSVAAVAVGFFGAGFMPGSVEAFAFSWAFLLSPPPPSLLSEIHRLPCNCPPLLRLRIYILQYSAKLFVFPPVRSAIHFSFAPAVPLIPRSSTVLLCSPFLRKQKFQDRATSCISPLCSANIARQLCPLPSAARLSS